MTKTWTIVFVCVVLLFLAAAVGGLVAAFGGSTTETTSQLNGGSINDPVLLGQESQAGSWKVALAGPLTEASQSVLSAAGLSQPPPGTKYYTATIAATDADPKALWFSATYALVGPHGDVFYPTEVMSSGAKTDVDAYPGDVVQVTLVLAVPEDQAPQGRIQITEINDGQAMFFSTH